MHVGSDWEEKEDGQAEGIYKVRASSHEDAARRNVFDAFEEGQQGQRGRQVLTVGLTIGGKVKLRVRSW
jgi:hypothetical protein